MWTVIILGIASVNFAVGNHLIGAAMCALAVALATLKQILPGSDDEE